MEYLLGSGLLGSLGILAWLAYVAVSSTRQRADAVIARAAAERDRDTARGEAAQRADELAHAKERIKTAEAALAAKAKELTDAKVAKVDDADPADAPTVVDGMLQDEARRRAGDHRDAAPVAVSPAGTAASDGPTPGWVGL